MGPFSTRHALLVCSRCGQPIGAASHRPYPGRLDVTELDGAPAVGERAGRVLQRLDEGAIPMAAGRIEELRRWLDAHAVELVYRFDCPTDGRVWVLAPGIAAGIRRRGSAATPVVVDAR